MGLEDESKWVQIHSSTSYISPHQGGIPPIRLLEPRGQPIIRIFCSSVNPRGTWRFGGFLFQFLSDGTQQPDLDANSWAIALEKLTIIEIPLITPVYRLRFEPARWHTQFTLQIGEFTTDF